MDDLISRKDVLHELDWCDYGLKDWQKWKLKMMVRDIPSAEPEVGSKEGYWIYLDNDELRYDSYRCSNCNRSITVDAERKDDIGFIIEDMKYCPCCGTKMIEVKL